MLPKVLINIFLMIYSLVATMKFNILNEYTFQRKKKTNSFPEIITFFSANFANFAV